MHFPVPIEQAKRFQLAVCEYFGLKPDQVLQLDVSHSGGDAYARVEASLVMPAETAIAMFNEAAEGAKVSSLNQRDLRVDVYKADMWDNPVVRVTHLPTGRVVSNHDTEDPDENKARAITVIRGMLDGSNR